MQSKIAAGAGGPSPKANIKKGELNGGAADNGPPKQHTTPLFYNALPGRQANIKKSDRKPQE